MLTRAKETNLQKSILIFIDFCWPKIHQVATQDAANKVGELSDQLEASKKAAEKVASSTRKLERNAAVTLKQLENAEKEKTELASKKKGLERELAKAFSYLQVVSWFFYVITFSKLIDSVWPSHILFDISILKT